MSFQTDEEIPPDPRCCSSSPRYERLRGADHRQAGHGVRHAGDMAFMNNLWNSVLLSTAALSPSRFCSACRRPTPSLRFKFRLGEDMAFTPLCLRFAPPLLVPLPWSALLSRALGLTGTYVGLIWVYRLEIALPADPVDRARLFRRHLAPDIEYAYRVRRALAWWRTFTRIAIPLAGPGIAAAGDSLALTFSLLEQPHLRAHSRVRPRRRPAGQRCGALAFVTASVVYPIWSDALRRSSSPVAPTLALALLRRALCLSRAAVSLAR